MNANTNSQLKYIKRDGKNDLSFVLSVRKAQASKYATQLLKQAATALLEAQDRWQDSMTGTSFSKRELEQQGIVKDSLTERRRNSQGMFVA